MNTLDNSPLEVSAPTKTDNCPTGGDMAPGLTDRIAATKKPAGHVEDSCDPKYASAPHSMPC